MLSNSLIEVFIVILQWYFFLGNMTFTLMAGVVIALIFYLPFVNMEAAFFYIKTKGVGMMFGRNPYEGLDLDISDIDGPSHIAPTISSEGADNYGMDTQTHIHHVAGPSAGYTPTNTGDESTSTKPVEVTEL